MTPAEYSAALSTIGWSSRHLAEKLRCNRNLPTQWSSGRVAVPAEVARWLDALARAHGRLPAPTAWRSRAA